LEPIDPSVVQAELTRLAGRDVYLHLETTTGTYTTLGPEGTPPCIAFVRNARIRFERGALKGPGPYRVGLKMDDGWVYGDGLTHAEVDDEGRLLMAGYDDQGRLRLGFELSETPFREGLE
jgi:hypothetical protein